MNFIELLEQEYEQLEEDRKPYLMDGAFWVSPRGEFMPTPSRQWHIGMILSQPQIFGLNRTEIERIYAKHGEQIGQEGDAREEIMVDLMKKGWIRIRRYRNHYSAQVYFLNTQTKKGLEIAANALLNTGVQGKYASPNDEFKITTANDRMQSLTVGEIIKGYLD